MNGCNEYNQLSRRQVLKAGVAAGALATVPWLPQVAFGQAGGSRDVMIVLFLGGGMDGLNVCVPYGDPHYYTNRPTIAVPRPDSTAALKAIDLDGFFGLPPGLAPLKQIYTDGKLAFVHATGADKSGWTRSHFDAQHWIESGKSNDINIATGWLGRHLATMQPMVASAPLRAIGFDSGMIDTLRGGPKTLPIPYPEYFGYDGWWSNQPEMINWIKTSYGLTTDPLKSAASDSVATVNLLHSIDFANYAPSGGAVYPANSDLGRALRATAAMIKAGIGLEAAAIEFGGWDTHNNQGVLTGYMNGMLTELGQCLHAFYVDMMSAQKPDWTLVGMSEFGRNAIENGSAGCDHGTANAMMLMGGHVLGGKVVRQWPGLAVDQLFEQQDLQVTIDYRDILAEIVAKRLKNTNGSAVFPGYTPTFRNLVAA